ncbi:MAG TPA: hypothetical protein VGH32_04745 [Pirellulales bacterium]
MNDDFDALESELSAFKPVEISPELRRRIAERLAEVERPSSVGGSRGGRRWLAAAAGGIVAVSLAALVFHFADNRPHPSVVVITQQTTPSASENSASSLLSYERALARSTDEFEALLDKDARSGARPNDGAAADSVFSWSNPKVHAFIGAE